MSDEQYIQRQGEDNNTEERSEQLSDEELNKVSGGSIRDLAKLLAEAEAKKAAELKGKP